MISCCCLFFVLPSSPSLSLHLSLCLSLSHTHTHTHHSSIPIPVFISCSVMSDSLRPHGLQPTRLFCPWVFSRQEYWGGLPCSPPGDLPNPGIRPQSPALQADSLTVIPLLQKINGPNCFGPACHHITLGATLTLVPQSLFFLPSSLGPGYFHILYLLPRMLFP